LPRSTLRLALCAGALCLAASLAVAVSAPASTRIESKRLNVRIGQRASVTGWAAPASTAALQIHRRGRWMTLDRDLAAASGRYALRRRLHRSQSVPARVRLGDGDVHRLGRLNVYRAALASWYGPGLYGNLTGCGGTLTPGRLGVAHKSLPCGARVTLRVGRHVLRGPVIDRGPYVGARAFDLTQTTAQRLHFRGPGMVLVAR
jgi:rare lipoprotein A